MEKIALADLDGVVEEVLAKLPQKKPAATIIALSGHLGAGKTTFVQTLGRKLGIVEVIQSPTYVLMKSYPIVYSHFEMFIHLDLYRLEKPEELSALKPETFLTQPENLICVEWPEKVGEKLPKPDITIKFSADGASPSERYIEII